MARKKRKKEEEVDFRLPEFDEKDYMRREVEGAKAALIVVAYAFVVALASFGLTRVGLAAVGGLVGFLALYGQKYLYPLFRVDTSRFDKKAWAGNGAIQIFSWLAFWILLLNPPIADVSPPVIHEATVVVPGMGNYTVTTGQPLEVAGDVTLTVRVRVTDNVQVSAVMITVAGESTPMERQTDDIWTHRFPVAGGTVAEVTVVAVDHQDLRSDPPFTFTLSAQG